MTRTWIIGDGHVDHEGVLELRPQFRNVAEHHDWFFSLLDAVPDTDTVIMVGDMFFSRSALYKLNSYSFIKRLVLGNHDTDREADMRDLVEVYDSVDLWLKKKGGFIITHVPMHVDVLRGKTNVHAHIHDEFIDDPRYICVSAESTGLQLLDFEEIRNGTFKTKNTTVANRHSGR